MNTTLSAPLHTAQPHVPRVRIGCTECARIHAKTHPDNPTAYGTWCNATDALDVAQKCQHDHSVDDHRPTVHVLEAQGLPDTGWMSARRAYNFAGTLAILNDSQRDIYTAYCTHVANSHISAFDAEVPKVDTCFVAYAGHFDNVRTFATTHARHDELFADATDAQFRAISAVLNWDAYITLIEDDIRIVDAPQGGVYVFYR